MQSTYFGDTRGSDFNGVLNAIQVLAEFISYVAKSRGSFRFQRLSLCSGAAAEGSAT